MNSLTPEQRQQALDRLSRKVRMEQERERQGRIAPFTLKIHHRIKNDNASIADLVEKLPEPVKKQDEDLQDEWNFLQGMDSSDESQEKRKRREERRQQLGDFSIGDTSYSNMDASGYSRA